MLALQVLALVLQQELQRKGRTLSVEHTLCLAQQVLQVLALQVLALVL